MTLSDHFEYWCGLRGYRVKPAVYMDSKFDGLENDDARLVRIIPPAQRGMRDAVAQTYTVEVRIKDEFFYPLGVLPMTRQRLRAAMDADTLERMAQ